MRYCILGGGGSFGLHTAKFLLGQSDTEWVLSIGRAPEKHKAFLLGLDNGVERYSYVRLHITHDFGRLYQLLREREPDVIINFAAQGEGATSFTESWRYFETNCVGLSRLVEDLALVKWLKRFVHIGSSEVYGSNDKPVDEDAGVRPTSPYAISKAAFDAYLLAMGRRGFECVIVRPSNCYGEGQQLHRLIPKAFLFGMTGREFPVHGGGIAEKSYLHSEDLARAIHLLAQPHTPPGIYNVGPEKPIRIIDLVKKIADTLSMDLAIRMVEDRAHQDSRYWLDSSKIWGLGWDPEISLEAGLIRVRDWVRDNLNVLRTMPTEFVMRP